MSQVPRPVPRQVLRQVLRRAIEARIDGRQSETALAVARGTSRLLHAHGFSVVSELPLASRRRADRKWMHYRRHCDRLLFATTTQVPREIFPRA